MNAGASGDGARPGQAPAQGQAQHDPPDETLVHALVGVHCVVESLAQSKDDLLPVGDDAQLVLARLLVTYAAQLVARDLHAFSAHARRRSVSTDDVLLLARRNPKLQQELEDALQRAKETG
ncbi:Centromere protein S [Porphyridium purpureum]|uniref:Centromere protein S n=1 Tax=Porphyridium purpureum TaxID=35688 RepID=A0A5J4Z4F5_PORPP|nr:Centromere protein S [Porphyridium purpureum]|eukprot:POR1538..scf295_1